MTRDLPAKLRRPEAHSYETEADSASIILTLRVGLKNIGDKAAAQTVLNVLAPESSRYLVWSTQTGDELSSRDDAAHTSETLTMRDGTNVAAHFIAKEIQRVPLRAGQVTWCRVDVQVPSELPVRVYAQSDDLPDDEEQARCDRTFHIPRKGVASP